MPSSVILAMHYEPERRELVIVFRGGRGAYRYFDVPLEEWETFRAAEAKGAYLNEIFKARGYRYQRDGETAAGGGASSDEGNPSLWWGEGWALRKPVASQSASDAWRETESVAG